MLSIFSQIDYYCVILANNTFCILILLEPKVSHGVIPAKLSPGEKVDRIILFYYRNYQEKMMDIEFELKEATAQRYNFWIYEFNKQ